MGTIPNYSYRGNAPGAVQQQSMFRAPKLLQRTSTQNFTDIPRGTDMRQYGRSGGPLEGQAMFYFAQPDGIPATGNGANLPPRQWTPPASVQPVQSAAPVMAPAAGADPALQGLSMFAGNMREARKDAAKNDGGIRIKGEDDDLATRAKDAIMGLFGAKVDPAKQTAKFAGMGDQVKAALAAPVAVKPMGMFR